MLKTKSGFTIVELLVVVVVIAILAAITIVVYSGISMSARNTQTISAAEAYAKAFPLYAVTASDGQLPGSGLVGRYCLGTTSCAGGNSTNDASLDTQLKSVTGGTLPRPSLGPGTDSVALINLGVSIKVVGQTVDGAPNNWILRYTLEGDNTNCGIRVLSGPAPNYTTATPAGNYTTSSSGTTSCVVLIR